MAQSNSKLRLEDSFLILSKRDFLEVTECQRSSLLTIIDSGYNVILKDVGRRLLMKS